VQVKTCFELLGEHRDLGDHGGDHGHTGLYRRANGGAFIDPALAAARRKVVEIFDIDWRPRPSPGVGATRSTSRASSLATLSKTTRAAG
jgi:hypothetical protein